MIKKIVLLSFLLPSVNALAQVNNSSNYNDSLYIDEVQDGQTPDKVLHAEPLYIDLIRDLGARKGERELNIGWGMTDNQNYDKYATLVEYEWAPVNRLGLEVELPFSFYYKNSKEANADSIPASKLDGLKLATQYSFYVSEKHSTSLALGYIHEFKLTTFNNYASNNIRTGNLYNPFLVAAKRWGQNFHTLVYTGPEVVKYTHIPKSDVSWQVNSNFHYMIPGTRNFVGIEFNKEFNKGDFDMTIRPQMRVSISDNMMIGIVSGIPISREGERFSTFFRLIYEPHGKH